MEAAAEDTQKESADNAAASNVGPLPASTTEPKKSKKDDRTKKDDKNLEQFMRSLNSIPTVDEKLSIVSKKYVQSMDDSKKMQFYIKQSDKRYALLSKEKEQLQLEFNKTILVKSKLENLCRELQKQNKAIKEESLLKIREEEERRKETQAKFQNTLSEITTMLQQNNEKNAKLRDDNISMTEKFKSVVTQYQLREQQVDKMSKQMALESQLSDAKMQKASLEYQADKEKLLAEMEQLKVTVATYRAKIMELQGTETNLRSQLAVYTDKYDEFQNALVKSNQMFGRFKVQMDKMSKKIKKLEKESLSWKTKWEASQTALLDMCTERQSNEEKSASTTRQLLHMQSLCRTLQAERTVLLNTLKEHNIERPPLPPPAPMPTAPPAPSPATNAKVDAMAANCAQLRQSLAHLQTQLNVLTNKQKEESPKPEVKPEKQEKQEKKKSKSKKNKAEKKVENIPKDESDDIDLTDVDIGSEITTENTDKVDDATLENLIQAINNANINLCDLEVVSDEIVETTKGVQITEIYENDVDGTTKGVKITEIIDENLAVSNDEKLTVTNDEKLTVTNDEKKVTNDEKTVTNDETTVTNDEKLTATNDEKLTVTKDEITNSSSLTDNTKVTTKNDDKTVDEIETPSQSDEIKLDEIKLDNNDISPNVSILESSNDEVSHINEVKPISNSD